MAEEIISHWDSAEDLLKELIADAPEERKTREVVDPDKDSPLKSFFDYAADPRTLGDDFVPVRDFRLKDGNGNTVPFPLTLISDTTFIAYDEVISDALPGS